MPEINLSLTFDENTKNILVSGIGATVINICYLADVDFTPLVEGLLNNIAVNDTFLLPLPATDNKDDKEKLVVKTISEIIDKYNEIVAVIPDNEETSEG